VSGSDKKRAEGRRMRDKVKNIFISSDRNFSIPAKIKEMFYKKALNSSLIPYSSSLTSAIVFSHSTIVGSNSLLISF